MSNFSTMNQIISTSLQFSLFKLIVFLIFIITYAYSYFVLPYHTDGDQLYYIEAYNKVADLEFIEALDVYRQIIFTREPIHFFIIWITSSLGFDKDVVMSFANALLASLFAMVLRRKGASTFWVLWITFSAYYLQTMFFTLERTKFAFIFMLLYLLTERRWLLILSVFSHALMLIPITLNLIGWKLSSDSAPSKKNQSAGLIKTSTVLASLILGGAIINSLGAHIYDKFSFYYHFYEGTRILEGLGSFFLCFLTLLTCQNKRKVLFFYLGLIVLSILLGSSRLNMLAFFGFLYFSNFKQQVFHVAALLLGSYFLHKSWMYVTNIYQFGG